MADIDSRTEWAEVRFPSVKRAEVPDHLLERVHGLYAWQAEDDVRFANAAPELLDRLDPARSTTIAMNCNSTFALLFENWAASCAAAGIEPQTSTLVFVTDIDAKQRVEALGYVAYFDAASEFLAGMRESHTYGDGNWSRYMYHQNWIIRSLIEFPQDVLFQDVDLVWMRNPVPFLCEQAAEGAVVQAMYDGPNPRFQPLYANSGFMYFRPNDRLRSFWNDVYKRHDMIAYYRSQQEPLNTLLAAHAHRGLDVRVLEEDQFANGHRYCPNRTPPPNPWVMHNSWTANLDEKIERYREHDLWFLDR